MKTLITVLLTVVVLAGGCVTQEKAAADARAAYFAGQATALNQLRLQQATTQPADSVVTIIGSVKNRTVPWTEDLSLVRALVAAEYVGAAELFSITITRAGKVMSVSPRQLLAGSVDPALEPGDVVTLR